MRIYRFERDGYGPYTLKSPNTLCTSSRLYQKLNVHEYSDDHPTSVWDYIPYDCSIGCVSLDSLKHWFKGLIGELVIHGYHIRVYEVPEEKVQFGFSGRQVGFYRDDVKEVIR